jgi:alkylhydroperoxidase family enzyme
MTAEAECFLPYVDLETVEDRTVTRLLEGTEERLGFVPNSFKLYLHQPHLLRDINRLNNTVMRHPDNLLPEEFKYRLALLVSRNQRCRYCTAHEVNSLKRKWGLTDDRIEQILRLEEPEDDREAAAWAYVDAASRAPEYVTPDIRQALVERFSPAEIMEIACTVGFWSLFNRIHASLDIPLEAHLEHEGRWVEIASPTASEAPLSGSQP